MVRKPCVYKNLAMEMFLQHMSINSLSKKTRINYKALCRKLNGETAMMLDEAIEIYKVIGKALPFEELFSRE